MTTKIAQELYELEHRARMAGKEWAVYNPHNMPVNELPVIFGFNNGGRVGWLDAALIAEDGTYLGGHICSSEAYMEHDLGILEGTRPDRHEEFKKHYPDGYRMEFVKHEEIDHNPKLLQAFELNEQTKKKD